MLLQENPCCKNQVFNACSSQKPAMIFTTEGKSYFCSQTPSLQPVSWINFRLTNNMTLRIAVLPACA